MYEYFFSCHLKLRPWDWLIPTKGFLAIGSLFTTLSIKQDSQCRIRGLIMNWKGWAGNAGAGTAKSLQWLRYRLDNPGSEPRQGRIFYLQKRPDRLWGPPSLLFNGYRGSFTGLKRPGREAGHSTLSSAKLRIRRTIPLLPLYGLWRE
jgi:hypothetical protein